MNEETYSKENENHCIFAKEKLLIGLESPGIQGASVGSIDFKNITVDILTDAIHSVSSLKMPLPEAIDLLYQLAKLILEIRLAFIRQNWDPVSSLLEKVMTLSSSIKASEIPDCCRLEIQTVRYEVENRWIISSISSAIMVGKLEVVRYSLSATTTSTQIRKKSILQSSSANLYIPEENVIEVNQFRLSAVSYQELANCLEACKVIVPRTPEASRMVHTAEILMGLRKSITETMENPSIWQDIYSRTESHLSQESLFMLSPIVYPELRAIKLASQDSVLCRKLELSWLTGNVKGSDPGSLDYSTVSTLTIDEALQYAEIVLNRTEKSKNLVTLCKIMKSLREKIIRIDHEYSVWKDIYGIINHYQSMIDSIKGSIDTYQAYCDEIELILHAAQVDEVKESLEDSCRHAITIYNARNTITIDQMEEQKSTILSHILNDQEVNDNQKRSTNQYSHPLVSPDLETYFDRTSLPLDDLEYILKIISKLKFRSNTLSIYVGCVDHLYNLRKAISNYDFKILESVIGSPDQSNDTLHSNMIVHRGDESIKQILNSVDIVKKEFAYIRKEYLNLLSLRQLQQNLYPIDQTAYTEQRLVELRKAIAVMDTYNLTSLASQQLLDCSKHVFLMRQAIFLRNSNQLMKELKWFESNSHRCPAPILDELENAYKIHEKNIILNNLLITLTRGQLTPAINRSLTNTNSNWSIDGKRDIPEERYSNIDVHELTSAIEQAHNSEFNDDEIERLLKSADIIYKIRSYQKDRQFTNLRMYLRSFKSFDEFHPIILNEIAAASYDADNEIVIHTLLEAVLSFDDTNSNSSDTLTNSKANMKKRRYSLKNALESNDIDMNSIEVDVLESALKTSKTIGLLSSEAKLLYKTVALLKILRQAMKLSQWTVVEDTFLSICSQHGFINQNKVEKGSLTPLSPNPSTLIDRKSNERSYLVHVSAWNELDAIQRQLQIRSSIVDISRAIKVGAAKFCNGVVDTTKVGVKDLKEAIQRSEKYLVDVNLSSTQFNSTKSNYQTKLSVKTISDQSLHDIRQQTVELIASAKRLIEVRELLLDGNIEQAGILSESTIVSTCESLGYHLDTSVSEELSTYAKEISEALKLMKVCDSLKQSLLSGNIEMIAAVLIDVVNNGSVNRFNYDLGFVRILERTFGIFKTWKAIFEQLLQLRRSFDVQSMKDILAEASLANMTGVIVEEIKLRMENIQNFEKSVEEIKKSNGGSFAQRMVTIKLVVELSEQKNLEQHPVAVKAKTLFTLNPSCLRTSIICSAIADRQSYVIATETIRLKRAYLSLESSREKYKLENYSAIRDPLEFEMYHRHPLPMKPAATAAQQMLSHTHQQIPTSITTLNGDPKYAAISVWAFNHIIRGIEKNLFTSPEVQLKSLVLLGRYLVPVRDEIFVQIIKQIRGNKENSVVTRLLKLLGACVFHFPPSRSFENYLESFLLTTSESRGVGVIAATAAAIHGALARQCIRFMHETIIKYGYDKTLGPNIKWSSNLASLREWLNDHGSVSHLLPMYPQLPQLPESLSELHSYYLTSADDILSSTMNSQSEDILPPPQPPTTSPVSLAAVAAVKEVYMCDLAFKESNAGISPSSNTATSHGFDSIINTMSIQAPIANLTHQIRGTKDNWVKRFSYFAGAYVNSRKARPPSLLYEEDFASALADPRTPLDPLDKYLLMYLIFGSEMELQTHWNQIVRELLDDKELLHFKSKAEEEASRLRIEWLKKNITIPFLAKELRIEDFTYEDIVDETKYFWTKYIDKLANVALSEQPEMKWNVTGELIKSKIKFHNQEVSLPLFEIPPTTGSANKTEINWELYHDLVVTGMSLFTEAKAQVIGNEKMNIQGFQITER